MGKLLAAVALILTLASATGALTLAGVDACGTPCAADAADQGCPPSADCCSCCTTAPSATRARPVLVDRDPGTVPLPSARPERPPLPAAADVFHVPLPSAV